MIKWIINNIFKFIVYTIKLRKIIQYYFLQIISYILFFLTHIYVHIYTHKYEHIHNIYLWNMHECLVTSIAHKYSISQMAFNIHLLSLISIYNPPCVAIIHTYIYLYFHTLYIYIYKYKYVQWIQTYTIEK